MDIKRVGTRSSRAAPEEYFTGRVRMEPIIDAPAPSAVRALTVTFEPGARTAWHTHPVGQTLIVTAGEGRVQVAGQSIQTISPGDVIWFAPGEKHWHGASPDVAMTHIAIQEAQDGSAADWLEKVTDAEYLGQ